MLEKIKDNLKENSLFVAVLNGEIKDNYMSYGYSEEQVKQRIIDFYYKEGGHSEEDLEREGIFITITQFENGEIAKVY
jgi:hypothetical protein